MEAFFRWAYRLPPLEAATLLLATNTAVFAGAVGIGALAVSRFRDRPVTAPPPALTVREVVFALSALVLNWLVTVVAWECWRRGAIRLPPASLARCVLDFVVLLVVMDFAMYWLHRLAHREPFFGMHRLHHRYEQPRPLTLFVTHPLETLAFGGLWLVAVLVIDPAWPALVAYLTLNVTAGVMGHLGVEPLPPMPIIGTSTFHAGHHVSLDGNFGFYSDVWDRLFRTRLP